MNKIGKFTAVLSCMIVSLFVAQSCVKDDDYAIPPIECVKVQSNITISDLLKKVETGSLKLADDGTIADDLIVEGFVITSDETGNIYKTISFQDNAVNPTAGVQIELDEAKTYLVYPLGSVIQVRLKGLVAGVDRGAVKIGSKDPQFAVGRIKKAQREKTVFKTCDEIVKVTPTVFKSIADAAKPANVNTLVTIEGVQIADADLGKNYAETTQTTNRKLVDKNNSQVDLRTSNFATFASDKLPQGSGKITVLVSKFGDSYQFFIRNVSDVNFDQPRFEVGGGNNGGDNPEPSASAVNLFAGADFEDWSVFLGSLTSHGLKDKYVSQGVGKGYEGTNSLHINGVPTGNDYVFTANAADNIPQNPTAITFRMKGKTTVRGLSFNVNATTNVTTGAGPQKYYVFNLPSVTSESVVLDYVQGNDYRGTIDTKGQWITIKLNIKDLKDLNLKNEGNGFFSVKAGSTGQYDIHIDNIRIE